MDIIIFIIIVIVISRIGRFIYQKKSQVKLIKPNRNRRQSPVHEARIGIENVLVELGQGGVEIRRVAEFHGEAVDLVDAGFGVDSAGRVVIAGA